VVLAWVLAQGPTVLIIPGARTIDHVLDSAATAEVELSEEDLSAIDRAEFSTA
jgi:aryl-alcohol dehydrogenase-like predicted oxidoreductase